MAQDDLVGNAPTERLVEWAEQGVFGRWGAPTPWIKPKVWRPTCSPDGLRLSIQAVRKELESKRRRRQFNRLDFGQTDVDAIVSHDRRVYAPTLKKVSLQAKANKPRPRPAHVAKNLDLLKACPSPASNRTVVPM